MAKRRPTPEGSAPKRPILPAGPTDKLYWNDEVRKALGQKMGQPELVDDPSFQRENWGEGVIEADIESMFGAKNSRRSRPARVPKR